MQFAAAKVCKIYSRNQLFVMYAEVLNCLIKQSLKPLKCEKAKCKQGNLATSALTTYME